MRKHLLVRGFFCCSSICVLLFTVSMQRCFANAQMSLGLFCQCLQPLFIIKPNLRKSSFLTVIYKVRKDCKFGMIVFPVQMIFQSCMEQWTIDNSWPMHICAKHASFGQTRDWSASIHWSHVKMIAQALKHNNESRNTVCPEAELMLHVQAPPLKLPELSSLSWNWIWFGTEFDLFSVRFQQCQICCHDVQVHVLNSCQEKTSDVSWFCSHVHSLCCHLAWTVL